MVVFTDHGKRKGDCLMTRSAADIVKGLRPFADRNGNVSGRQIMLCFAKEGYGVTAAKKWMTEYLDLGILYPNGVDEDGRTRYTCTWWTRGVGIDYL